MRTRKEARLKWGPMQSGLRAEKADGYLKRVADPEKTHGAGCDRSLTVPMLLTAIGVHVV